MEVGHLLLRWWGRGPNAGWSCHAQGLPGTVSLPWHPEVPYQSLQREVHSLPLFVQAFSMRYTLYLFFEPASNAFFGRHSTNLGSKSLFPCPSLLQLYVP